MTSESAASTLEVGSEPFVYTAVPNWEKLPDGWSFVEAVGVAADSQDRVYVFNRGEHPVIVFDSEGNFLHAWGEGQFVRPHGIWIDPDDTLYLTDDQDHTVRKYTPRGELLQTIGTSGQASDTGIDGIDYRTIKRPGEPFNLPTNVARSPSGDLYITDGYGNCRVHRFSPDGELLASWGEPGDGPGQFNLPHGIGIDGTGRVFIADRENNRLQLFSPEGEFIEEWTGIARPCNLFFDADDNVFVAEVGQRAGLFHWLEVPDNPPGGRLSIFDRGGNLRACWGGGDNPCAPTDFFAPHDIWLDTKGSIYVGEVTMSAGGNKGLVPPDCPTLRKFVRRT